MRYSSNAHPWTYLRLLALLEERVLTRLVGGLILGEVAVLADLVQDLRVDALQVNLGRGSNNISGVYPSQRNAVNFERTGDEEDTLGKVLQENDALAAETTGEEDDDGTGLERSPRFRRTDRLASLELQLADVLLKYIQFPIHHHRACSRRRYAITCICLCSMSSSCWCFVCDVAGVEVNVPSWRQQRPQPGSTCSPSGASVPLCWPPFRIAVVVSCPGKLDGSRISSSCALPSLALAVWPVNSYSAPGVGCACRMPHRCYRASKPGSSSSQASLPQTPRHPSACRFNHS